MKLIDTDFTLAEREQLEAAMGSDKTVLWAGRPVAKAWSAESVMAVCSGVVASGILGYMTATIWGGNCCNSLMPNLIFSCFLLPFWGVVLWQLLTPWRQLRRRRRTAYMLTAQQAVVLEPTWFGRQKLTAYPVQPGMVKEREVVPDGSGSLVFAYRVVHGKNGSRQIPQGFLNIPQVQQVTEILDSLAAGEYVLSDAAPAESAQQQAAGGKSVVGVIFGCIFALAGIAMLVFSGGMISDSYQIVTDGVAVQGEVVSLKRERSSGRRGGSSYYPIFRFTAQDGQEYRVKHNQGSNPPAWKKGEKVELLYLPDEPEKAVPNTFWGKYGASVILVVMGCGFTALGSFVAWQSRKTNRD